MSSIINGDTLFDVYKSLFDFNQDGCYAIDPEGNFKLFNHAASEVTGYTIEEALQMSFFPLIHPLHAEKTDCHFRKILQGKQEQFETSILHKSGKKIDLLITGVPIFIHGEICGIVGTANDNTEKNNLAALLKGQNEILEMVTKGCPFTKVMNDIIFLVEKVSDGVVGSIHLKESDRAFLFCCSAPNLPNTYRNFIKEIPIGPASGSCGTAAYTKKSILVSDIATDLLWKDYKTIALQHGLHACWSNPVFDNQNNVLGVFAMYYDKPCNPTAWDQQVVKEATYLISLVVQHYHAEEKINFMAFHDHLTGLPNRRLFDERITASLGVSAESEAHTSSVFYLDLDRFKLINDSLGHNIGDMLLKDVAQRLQKCLRRHDVISRQGGDEFTILFQRVHRQELSMTAQRLLDELSHPFSVGGHEIFVTASIGISTYPEDGQTADELLSKADAAMYQAKQEGRNNFKFYHSGLSEKTHKRLEIENELRRALNSKELSLHYQPIFNLATNTIAGAEALIRWTSPKLGSIPPAVFIPVAEETGMIVPMGEWIIRTACQQLKKWEKKNIPIPSISVNISIRQFYQPDLISMIASILAETGVNPANLIIEITESMTMDVGVATTILHGLKKLGVKLSIDDFGTGYSSLNYLKTFPIDSLKIDQSFIEHIASSKSDEDIAAMILLMAEVLNLKVIAEGVETSGQLDVLIRNKCDYAQGFLFSRPLSNEQLEAFARRNFTVPSAYSSNLG